MKIVVSGRLIKHNLQKKSAALNRPAACVWSPLRTAGICAVNGVCSCVVCGGGTAVVATVISMDPSGGDSTSPYM